MLFVDGGNNAVGIGTNSPASYYSSSLVVSVPDEDGITILNSPDHAGYLMFADGTSSNAAYRGFLMYDHGPEIFVMNSAANIEINASNGYSTVVNQNGYDIDFRVESNNLASAFFLDGGTGKVTMQGATTTIGSAVASTNVEFNLNGVASKAQRIQFQESGVNRWLLGQGAASETTAFELYNSTGTIALSVNRSTNAATFASDVIITGTSVIAHGGDTDTYLQFDGDDKFRVVTNGAERFAVINEGVVVNEDSHDQDFRVESNVNANMLFVDGGNNRVCIGHNINTPTVSNLVFDVRNMAQVGQSFYQGIVANTGNDNTGFISLFNLTTAASNNVGCLFDGTLIVQSYTGFSRVRFTASRYFTNSAIAFSVADIRDGSGSAGGINLSLVTATVGGESFLGVQKINGGTGTSYINAFVGGTVDIREIASGSYTVTTTHGTLIT
jgi:hypothetical protein